MSDYNNRPAHLAELLKEWQEANKTRRPFLSRIAYWLDMRYLGFRVSWASTEWEYPTIHGISYESFPSWSEP